MTSGAASIAVDRSRRALFGAVLVWWAGLAAFGAWVPLLLAQTWPAWPWAFAAAAAWGLNLLILVFGVGPPFRVSRPPILDAGFALLLTIFGTGSYWATTQLYPGYRVGIEYAAWFVAACTTVTLSVVAITEGLLRRRAGQAPRGLEWDWPRLGAATYLVFAVAAVGTVVSIRRIGYVPVLVGDPISARVDFPAIGGVWYRLSMLGGVAALLVAVQ